jgi:hypothetical protein
MLGWVSADLREKSKHAMLAGQDKTRQETCSALRVKKGTVSRPAGWGPNLMYLYQGCCRCEVARLIFLALAVSIRLCPRAPDTGDPALFSLFVKPSPQILSNVNDAGLKKSQSDSVNPVLSDCNYKHQVPIAPSVFRAQAAACVWAAGNRGWEEWGFGLEAVPALTRGGGAGGRELKRREEKKRGADRRGFIHGTRTRTSTPTPTQAVVRTGSQTWDAGEKLGPG